MTNASKAEIIGLRRHHLERHRLHRRKITRAALNRHHAVSEAAKKCLGQARLPWSPRSKVSCRLFIARGVPARLHLAVAIWACCLA